MRTKKFTPMLMLTLLLIPSFTFVIADSDLNVETVGDDFEPGEDVDIVGTASVNSTVQIIIVYNETDTMLDTTLSTLEDGTFSLTYMLSEEAMSGIYKVSVLSGEEESFTSFKVEIDEPEVEEEPEVEDEEPENETEPLENEPEDGGRPQGFQLPKPSFTPGHPLYGLEIFTEEFIEVPLAGLFGGPIAAAQKRLRLAEERLAEFEAIANGNNSNALERLRNRYEFQLNKTEALANRINSLDFETFITERTMHHIDVLTDLSVRLPVQAQQGIETALGASTRFFSAHMHRVAVKIQQIEGQGVNATQMKMELENLRNRTLTRIMEFKESLNVTLPSGYDVDIEIPGVPQFSMGKGNKTLRGPP